MSKRSGPAAGHLRRAARLYDSGSFDAALDQCRLARAADPGSAEAYRLTGAVCLRLDNPQAAASALEIAVRLDPMDAAARSNLGAAYHALRRLQEALDCLEAGLALDPRLAPLWFNIAVVLDDLERWEDAAQACRRVLALDPAHVGACARLTDLLHYQGRLSDAEACARAGLAMAPQAAALHGCLGLVLLAQGALGPGWAELEWRWLTPKLARAQRHAARPLWTGDRLDGQVLLLHAEQGYGDTLQFCRYATRIAGASRIVLQVPPALVGLLGTLRPDLEIVADNDPLPAFDLHCPMMSLAARLGTVTTADIPSGVPYLHADPPVTARWAARLDALPGLKVGLCWAGGHRPDVDAQRADRRRSLQLSQLAPLAQVGGITLVSLQKGPPADEARAPPPGLRLVDWTAELADFADTAALVTALDLVVTVDTAVAHLAGALGRPVWMLNRFDSDWRWLRAGDESPWYPTLRQFRQSRPGVWSDVVDRLAQALADRAAA